MFDIKEYSGSMAENNIWAHNLASLIRSEPFIILGTSLEEPDLAYFLSDRFSVPIRSDRAPSIFVEPFPDEATESDCAEYRVSLFPKTALEFLTYIDERFPDRTSMRDDLLSKFSEIDEDKVDVKFMAEFLADFERVPLARTLGDAKGANFALGHRVAWEDLKVDLDISRDITGRVQTAVKAKQTGMFHIVVGPAGAGKTTILRRIASNLSQEGCHCFWHHSIGRIRIDSVKEIVNSLEGVVYFFVDNFADSILDFVEVLKAFSPGKVVVLGAERWYRLDHIKRVVGEGLVNEYVVNAVGLNATKLLVDRYSQLGISNPNIAIEYTYPVSNDPIAIACCRIMHNFQPLGEIVKASLSHSSEIQRNCYAFASLASYCVRHGIEYSIISQQYPNYQVDKMIDDMLPLPLELRERAEVEYVTPLNEAFSDTILREWSESKPNELLDIFTILANAIRPRVSLRAIIAGEPNSKLAARLFDYDEVVKPFLGVELAEQFYARTKQKWDWNSRYWHQVAQLKMDQASQEVDKKRRRELADLAVQHAKFTESIEPDHQFTFTTIGRMIFRKFDVLSQVGAADLSDAIKFLLKAIRIERRKDRASVHPYMILFRGVSAALSDGARLSPEQIADLMRTIREAGADFPRDKQLLAAGQELKKLL